MTTERADIITDKFNARDNEGAVRAIQDAQSKDPGFWQNNRDRINQDVDFKALGFPSDFIIEGVNSRGQLVTTDGDRLQHRTGVDLRVVHQSQASPPGERIGTDGRTVQTDDQGKTTYTIKQGDALDWVARDLVREKTGREATPQEIVAARQAIAKENNLRDVNRIPVGTKLKIPDSLRNEAEPKDTTNPPPRPGQPPRARGVTLDESRKSTDDGEYKSFAPPGTTDKPGALGIAQGSLWQRDRVNERREPGPNGRDINKYETKIGLFDPVDVSVSEQVNPRTGVLESRRVDYKEGVTFTIKTSDAGGTIELKDVKSADTKRTANGDYVTVYKTADGKTYTATAKPDGTPRYFQRR